MDVGYSAAELRAAGFTASEHKDAKFAVHVLRTVGAFPADDLENVGYTAKQLNEGGYTPAEIITASYTCEQLREGGCGPFSCQESRVYRVPPYTAADSPTHRISHPSFSILMHMRMRMRMNMHLHASRKRACHLTESMPRRGPCAMQVQRHRAQIRWRQRQRAQAWGVHAALTRTHKAPIGHTHTHMPCTELLCPNARAIRCV